MCVREKLAHKKINVSVFFFLSFKKKWKRKDKQQIKTFNLYMSPQKEEKLLE